MEVQKSKASKWNCASSCIIACAVVALCAIFSPKNQKLYIENKETHSYISLMPVFTNDVPDISIGFFVPTCYNVDHKEAVPKLFYNVSLVDISSINVFKNTEKSEIIANIDAFSNVFVSNILDGVYLSGHKNICDVEHSSHGDVEICDIFNGDKKISNSDYESDSAAIVVHKDSGNFFCVPSEIGTVFQEDLKLFDYKNFDTRFFKISRVK